MALWVAVVVCYGIFGGYDQRASYHFRFAITQPLTPEVDSNGPPRDPAGASSKAPGVEAAQGVAGAPVATAGVAGEARLPGAAVAPAETATARAPAPTVESTGQGSVATTATATTTQVWNSKELFPNSRAPRLFVIEHIDGAGHRMKTIIEGIAVAVKNRMNFGGVMPVPNTVTEHGHDFRKVVDAFFGGRASEALFPAKRPEFAFEFKGGVRELEDKREDIKEMTSVYCPNTNEWEMMQVPTSRYFSPALRAALRNPLEQRSLNFAPGKAAVAVHLRRGDLRPGEHRATEDKYYFELLKHLRAELPEADVHVWSSTKNILADPKHPRWKETDFDGYRQWGATVHLDDADLLDPWAHMARAHVLIMSMSSFSIVPGMLNQNCVIYAGSVSKPLDGWVNGMEQKRKSYVEELKACFARARVAAGLPAKKGDVAQPVQDELPRVERQQQPPPPATPVAGASEEAAAKPAGTPSSEAELRGHIARVARARAGLYKDKTSHPEFAHTVLVTGANFAYFPFYENWRCFAERHGLDWAVIANDDEAYKRLGTDRGMPVLGEKISGMVGWGNVKLDSVGRNKMFMMVQIMNLTGLDILFSDADNVFRMDPFRPGVSIGDLIRSRKYDYIYEEELQKAPPKGHVAPGDGGNTGFFYVAGSRKPQRIQAFFTAVVDKVDSIRRKNRNSGADQPIFWDVMNEMRRSQGREEGRFGFRCAKMCGQQPTCKASDEETLEYCAMDPFMHPTGWEDPPPSSASYHANYATNEGKIGKLKKAKVWVTVNSATGACPAIEGAP